MPLFCPDALCYWRSSPAVISLCSTSRGTLTRVCWQHYLSSGMHSAVTDRLLCCDPLPKANSTALLTALGLVSIWATKLLVLYTPLLLVMSSTDFLFPFTPEKTVHTNPSSSTQEPLLARLPTHKHKDSVLKRAQSFTFWIHSSGLQGILLYVLHSNTQ